MSDACPDCGGERAVIGRNAEGEILECDECGRRDVFPYDDAGPPGMRAAPGSTGAIAHVSPPSSTPGKVVDFPDIEAIAPDIGGCRRCGANSGTLNVGSDAWGFCIDHGQRWFVGEVDPSWRFEDETMWEENELFLAAFRTVEPLRRVAGE